jgi:transcriptional regulator with XRE-family HTH domain
MTYVWSRQLLATIHDMNSGVKELSTKRYGLSSRLAWQMQDQTDKMWREMASRPTELPRILKQFRTRAGLTQEQASEVLGLRLRDFQRYEGGHNLPRRPTVERLAKKLKIPARKFYPSVSSLPAEDLGEYVEMQEDALERLEKRVEELHAMVTQLLQAAHNATAARVLDEAAAQAAPPKKPSRRKRANPGRSANRAA